MISVGRSSDIEQDIVDLGTHARPCTARPSDTPWGAGKNPLTISIGHLVVGERSLLGPITGTPYENEKTLDFSALADVRPRIEVMPFEQANKAYQRMKTG